jgi:hypothetical protein
LAGGDTASFGFVLGVGYMAYETKVILTLLAQQISKCETIDEAYLAVTMAANVEGLELPPLMEMKEKMANAGKR